MADEKGWFGVGEIIFFLVGFAIGVWLKSWVAVAAVMGITLGYLGRVAIEKSREKKKR